MDPGQFVSSKEDVPESSLAQLASPLVLIDEVVEALEL